MALSRISPNLYKQLSPHNCSRPVSTMRWLDILLLSFMVYTPYSHRGMFFQYFSVLRLTRHLLPSTNSSFTKNIRSGTILRIAPSRFSPTGTKKPKRPSGGERAKAMPRNGLASLVTKSTTRSVPPPSGSPT